MIIKGKSRSDPSDLAAHLGNTEKNERAEVLEVRGTIGQTMRSAFAEMDAWALGTKCQKPLYHANLDPQPPNRLTPEQRDEAINALEKKLGFEGHARVVVLHEKYGREHFHIVWSRIDTDKMRAVSDSHNYRKHEEAARDLERRFGHERVQGAHAERDGVERPDRTPSRAELRQEERSGIKGKDVREEVSALFRSSDNAEAFRAALEDQLYILAKGDRRDFVIVDCAGGIHSLARRIDTMKAADLREFMSPIDPKSLPTAEQAKGIQFDRQHGLSNASDEISWEDQLAQAAVTKAKAELADQRKRRAEKRADRKENLIEKAYAGGDGYVTQTAAAQREFEVRQKKLDAQPKPQHPDSHKRRSVAGAFNAEGERATNRQSPDAAEDRSNTNDGVPIGPDSDRFDHAEFGREKYKRVDKLLYGEDGYKKSELRRTAVEKDLAERKLQKDRAGAAPSDKAFAEKTTRFDHKEFAETRYRLNDLGIYGEGGYLKSEQARQALERDDEKKRAKMNEEELLRRQAEDTTKGQRAQAETLGSRSESANSTGNEMTDAKRARLARLRNAIHEEDRWNERDDPDRQREAPGGGRTRSR